MLEGKPLWVQIIVAGPFVLLLLAMVAAVLGGIAERNLGRLPWPKRARSLLCRLGCHDWTGDIGPSGRLCEDWGGWCEACAHCEARQSGSNRN